jgi:hypothetical protein
VKKEASSLLSDVENTTKSVRRRATKAADELLATYVKSALNARIHLISEVF